jgi:hypothetical protein
MSAGKTILEAHVLLKLKDYTIGKFRNSSGTITQSVKINNGYTSDTRISVNAVIFANEGYTTI